MATLRSFLEEHLCCLKRTPISSLVRSIKSTLPSLSDASQSNKRKRLHRLLTLFQLYLSQISPIIDQLVLKYQSTWVSSPSLSDHVDFRSQIPSLCALIQQRLFSSITLSLSHSPLSDYLSSCTLSHSTPLPSRLLSSSFPLSSPPPLSSSSPPPSLLFHLYSQFH
mmetsp:Transcript_8605/g.12692  ORF Transcript_8605/g.12692 Transcript_8605/m.12692 type:complete len:166 (+) Transcript_8605:2400-2897(+)